jgi:hypothetical protein
MPQEKKYFADPQGNGLNADDDLFAIQLNEVVNMNDCRIGSTDSGVTGTVESNGGTLLLSTPDADYIENGRIDDEVGNRVIFFKIDTAGSEDKIMVYDNEDGIEYLALLSSQVEGGLNLSKDYPIHSARVVNGVAYWTDNLSSPRKLNLDAAIKLNNPAYVTTQEPYSDPLEKDVISIIRKPPSIPLFANKTTDGGITVNNVENFAGQFAWRYVFRDGEVGVLSPVSNFINYNSVSDTGNTIAVVATNSSGGALDHIPQDVQQVDFCVRYGNSGGFFIIKSWNKNVAADAALIALHNTGADPLDIGFLNDRTGIALDDAYSVKPYDSVPLLSETLETGLGRLFLGGNTSDFNTPVLTSLAATVTTDTNHTPFQNPVFKAAGVYKLGIVFRDRYKRVIGNVVTTDDLKFQIDDKDYPVTTYTKVLAWTLSNVAAVDEIPIEAEYYEVVITKNLKTRFFIDAKVAAMKYAIKNSVTGIITYTDTYTSAAYGLAFDASYLPTEGIGYQFSEGDIIKVYQSASATIYSLPVIFQDGSYVISKLENLGSFATQPDIIFEIYTPYRESLTEPFYTVGEVFDVTNFGTAFRTYASVSGNISGDVYLFNRAYPAGTYVAENMSPSPKHWSEWLGNYGEINLVINSKQVVKKTGVRWSNVFIEGTQTNGLSTFDALDEKILPFDMGALRKLQQTSKVQEQGNIMLAIGEQQTASLYLGEVQVVGASQNAFLASSPNVIGTINILKGNFGTTMPTSVVEYRGTVFWYDINSGRWIQYASNGLFPISDYKMRRVWKEWAKQFLSMTSAEIEAFGGRPFVFAIVDPAHDELLISIPKLAVLPPKGELESYPNLVDATTRIYPFDILDFRGKTIVYDLKYSRWRGSFSFYAEGFAAIRNNLYSFTGGQMWLHNQSGNQCNYYGVQYKPQVMCVSNFAPAEPKVYNSMAISSNICPSFVCYYSLYPYTQLTDIYDSDVPGFYNQEGIWMANIKRNKLVPTALGFRTDGLLTFEKMRGVNMMVMLEFEVDTVPLELKFVDFNFSISHGHVPKTATQ